MQIEFILEVVEFELHRHKLHRQLAHLKKYKPKVKVKDVVDEAQVKAAGRRCRLRHGREHVAGPLRHKYGLVLVLVLAHRRSRFPHPATEINMMNCDRITINCIFDRNPSSLLPQVPRVEESDAGKLRDVLPLEGGAAGALPESAVKSRVVVRTIEKARDWGSE